MHRAHESRRAAEDRLRQSRKRHDHLLAQRSRQRQDLATLKEKADALNNDLTRCRTMGAIRRFFSGLNEEKLKKEMSVTQTRITSTGHSYRSSQEDLIQLRQRMSSEKLDLAQLRRVTEQAGSEDTCRAELQQQTAVLQRLTSQVKDLEEQIRSLRQTLLENCRIVATTVYQSYLRAEVARRYDTVIIDEASMLMLPMVLRTAPPDLPTTA